MSLTEFHITYTLEDVSVRFIESHLFPETTAAFPFTVIDDPGNTFQVTETPVIP
jgi:hypothetical protein